MGKRKVLNLMITIFFAFLLMFVVSDVNAGLYESCEAVSIAKNGISLPSPYTMNVNKNGGSSWPINASCNGDQCYGYFYDLLNNGSAASGINQTNTPVYVSALKPMQIYLKSADVPSTVTQVLLPGAGDITGYGEFHEFIARGAANDALPSLKIYTNQNDVFITTIAFKVGSTDYYCGPILAPAGQWDTRFAQGAVISASTVTTEDGKEWCLAADPTTQCDVVVDCDNGEPAASIPITDFSFGKTGSTEQVVFSASPGQTCPKFYIKNNAANTDYMCINNRCYPCPPYRCQ
jgi:hypothetical protein